MNFVYSIQDILGSGDIVYNRQTSSLGDQGIMTCVNVP